MKLKVKQKVDQGRNLKILSFFGLTLVIFGKMVYNGTIIVLTLKKMSLGYAL